jgi:hypothetical protein
MGFTKNVGSANEAPVTIYSNSGSLASVQRISPRVLWRISNMTFAAEYESTSANYEYPQINNNSLSREKTVNDRLLIAVYYRF